MILSASGLTPSDVTSLAIEAATSSNHAKPDKITIIQLATASRSCVALTQGWNLSMSPQTDVTGFNTIKGKANTAANRIDTAMWTDRPKASQSIIPTGS